MCHLVLGILKWVKSYKCDKIQTCNIIASLPPNNNQNRVTVQTFYYFVENIPSGKGVKVN